MTIATKVWIVQLIELYCISQRGAGGGAVLGEDVPPVLLQPAVPRGGRVRAGGLLAQRRPQHQHPHLRGGAFIAIEHSLLAYIRQLFGGAADQVDSLNKI